MARAAARRGIVGRLMADRRGTIALVFALWLIPMTILVSAAMDYSSLATARSMLQSAVDNGALSGAAAYTTNSSGAQSQAIIAATSSFCEIGSKLPGNMTLVGVGATACVAGSGLGPTVTTQIAGFKAGTPGITTSSCSATTPVVSGGIKCGFVVKVTATAAMTHSFSSLLGSPKTISATAYAANPFINIATNINASINGSASYQNSLWIYPLVLNANGVADFTANAGAIPSLVSGSYPSDSGPTSCTSLTSCGPAGTAAGPNCVQNSSCGSSGSASCSNPAVFTCGPFTMLANTYYNTAANPCPASSPCTPNGAGNYPTIIQGVIQNPQAPAAIITATTPLGVAFVSLSGGSGSYGYLNTSNALANGCYQAFQTVYTTTSQVYANGTSNAAGGAYAAASANGGGAMDWPKVAHWFYSSYLSNSQAPSYGEIMSQTHPLTFTQPSGAASYSYNTRVPSVGLDTSGQFSPTIPTCQTNKSNGDTYDQFLLTNYPTSGSTNGSLFILNQPAGTALTAPASTSYAGQFYTPASTPGAQYASLSCQSFINRVVTFYWNDMGGRSSDDLDYGNGILRMQCTGISYVLLIG